jgi:hypothetical protein
LPISLKEVPAALRHWRLFCRGTTGDGTRIESIFPSRSLVFRGYAPLRNVSDLARLPAWAALIGGSIRLLHHRQICGQGTSGHGWGFEPRRAGDSPRLPLPRSIRVLHH